MANANLFQQYLQQPRSAVEFSNDLDKQEMNDLSLRQARQTADDDNALRRAAQGFGGDTTANYQSLLRAGLPTQAAAYQKGIVETQAKQAETDKNKAQGTNFTSQANDRDYDLKVKKVNQALSDIASYQSPQQALAQLQAHTAAGDIDAQKAQMIQQQLQSLQSPGDFAQWQVNMLRGIMSAKDALESRKLSFQTSNTGGQTVTQARDPLTGQVVTQTAIQNTQSPDSVASNATSRANNRDTINAENTRAEKTRDAGKWQYDSDRGGVVNTATGEFKAATKDGVPVGPKPGSEKPLTEGQGKATTFAARMQDAENTIGRLEPAGVSGSDLRTIAAGNVYTNWLASPAGQEYRQAQENWVTANLRAESGAAIGKDEMAKDVRKFFPTPGDSKEVIAQKSRARAVAQQGMLAQAGPGAKEVPKILSNASAPNTVQTPDGQTHTFPSAEAAAAFRKAAGL